MIPSTKVIPLVIAPPCLIQDARRFVFAHLHTPMHNSFPLILRAIQKLGGNPGFAIASSWHNSGCITFASANDNVVDRAFLVFDKMVEIEAVEFPHKMWHTQGINHVLRGTDDVCSVDQYCLDDMDYTTICALVIVSRGKPLPDSTAI